ncbi:MAG: glycine cleavage system protein R [Gammaproteobacteria bacterium]
MNKWYMLVVVGKDRPGIVAKVTSALFDGGCNLGEASMALLGGNFSIMLMVQHEGSARTLEDMLETVVDSLGLHLHIDQIDGGLHRYVEPDVRITIFGADRAGIVAHATGALAEAGLNILNLESDVAGTEEKPIYILHIEGQATEGIESLHSALDIISKEGVETSLLEMDTVIG